MRALLMIIFGMSLLVSISTQATKKIVVGGKQFTEQLILTRMLTVAYRTAGYQVEEKANIMSRNLRNAQLKGKVDVYWEYTGTSYVAYHKQNDSSVYTNSKKLFAEVRKLDAAKGLTWLQAANANNTYAIAIPPQIVQQYPNLKTLSDMATHFRHNKPLRFGLSFQFYQRPDGFKGLTKHYNFKIPKPFIKKLEHSAIHNALIRGQIDIGMVYSTDAQIKNYELRVLQDDKNFFPVYQPAPVFRTVVLQKHPDLGAIANRIAHHIDTDTLIRLNYLVDLKKQDIDTVATNWLQQQGLLPK